MAGRPSDYEPRFAQIARELMLEGASMMELGWHLRKSQQCLYEWIEKFPEFGEAVNQSKEFAQGWWMHEARMNIRNKEFNSTLWYMNMKNRFGWVDKQEVKQESIVTLQLSQEAEEVKRLRLEHEKSI